MLLGLTGIKQKAQETTLLQDLPIERAARNMCRSVDQPRPTGVTTSQRAKNLLDSDRPPSARIMFSPILKAKGISKMVQVKYLRRETFQEVGLHGWFEPVLSLPPLKMRRAVPILASPSRFPVLVEEEFWNDCSQPDPQKESSAKVAALFMTTHHGLTILALHP